MTTETVRTVNNMELPSKNHELRRFFRVFLSRKIVIIYGMIILAMFIMALFAEFIAPYDPYQQNLAKALQKPSMENWLGTDGLGRDVLSRIIYGARISLFVGCVSVLGAALIGILLGLISGYFGGFLDLVISRIIDALLSFPSLVLALAIGVALGSGMWTVIIALIFGLLPSFTRVMRGQVLSVKESDYIKAAEVIGSNNFRILMKHVLPNCISPIIVLISLNMGIAILSEATLSFLGVGITAPDAAWGAMVSEGQRYLLRNPILSFAPGLCIMLVVLAFNMVGDALRDALDPKLRGTI